MKSILRNIIIFFCCSCISCFTYSQIKLLDIHQLDSVLKVDQKPVIIFIHTDWCKYCQAMEQSTFKQKEVIELINKKFHFVKLNAEEKEDIIFQNKVYSFQPNGINTGVHELAKELANVSGEIIYPTICILNNTYHINLKKQGFISSKQMVFLLLNYNDK
jgi:thioredoxin-related protein